MNTGREVKLRGSGLAAPRRPGMTVTHSRKKVTRSPADFGRLIAKEAEKWAKVVKFAHIKAE